MNRTYYTIYSFILALLIILPLSAIDNYTPYSFNNLVNYPFKPSIITLTKVIENNNDFITYQGTFQTMGRTMSLYLGVPKSPLGAKSQGVVLMLRGHQNIAGYDTGKGTQYPARAYMRAGFIIVSPDFFGFGTSDAPPFGEINSAESYLIMPISAIELLRSLETPQIKFATGISPHPLLQSSSLGSIKLWGHSNGGLVALHLLALTGQSLPTVLWAPVSLDFAHASAFYKGRNNPVASAKATQFIEKFTKIYNLKEYSLQYQLHRIAPSTPIMLRQGDKDNAVPYTWSEQFNKKMIDENHRRTLISIKPINFEYILYKGANHNLEPYWAQILPADIAWWLNN
jgi:dienelactone hydrolase